MDAAAPVRVLHVVKGLGPGGAERLLVSVAEVADPAVVQYQVAYVLEGKQHLVPELERIGVATHLLAGRRGLADPRWPIRLRRLARTVDVVHLHSPAVAALARVALLPRRRGSVVVSTEHNVWRSHGRVTRLANAVTLPLDKVRWAVSREVVESAWRPWRARTEVVVHGVPLAALRARRAERDAARSAQGWSADDVVVAIVANLRASKDYPTFFEACALACAEEPRLRFVSIGQGGLEADLRMALQRRGLGDRVVMLGYHEDPAAVLVGADAFTLSSRHEGLPISLLEAMALGLAPVVTAVGGILEVVTDGVDGLLVPAGQPEALAAAYVRLVQECGLRERLGTAAAARVEAFDIARARESSRPAIGVSLPPVRGHSIAGVGAGAGARASVQRGIGRAVKVAAAGADVVRSAPPGLVILIYHRVGGVSRSAVDLPTARFDEQVAELSSAGRLLSLDAALARLEAEDVDDRPVVITFDDGTADWVDEALPVLTRHQAPATFYVATDFVDQGRPFPDGGAPVSWSGLRELVASGLATIGSHTHTHALLDRADAATTTTELDRSVALLGEHLGVACEHFAYPKALLGSPTAEALVRQRFRSATVAGTRGNPAGSDLHRLHRTPIQVADGMAWFRRKADGGMRLEDSVRQLLNRRRYAGATT